jgi:hypothetical protein
MVHYAISSTECLLSPVALIPKPEQTSNTSDLGTCALIRLSPSPTVETEFKFLLQFRAAVVAVALLA